MQSNATKYILNVFGDFQNIVPSNSIYYTYLFKVLPNYIPSNIQEMTPFGQSQRIVMENSEQNIKILILNNSIILEKSIINGAQDTLSSIESFCSYSADFLEKFFREFDKIGYRVALIAKYAISDNINFDDLRKKLLKTPSIYESENVFEWNWRMVVDQKKILGDKEEQVNYLFAVNRFQGKNLINNTLIDFDGIDIEIEVNTSHLNTQPRFSEKNITNILLDIPLLHLAQVKTFKDFTDMSN